MTIKELHRTAVRTLPVCIFLLLTFGAVKGQENIQMKNTALEISPGLYQCTIYLAIDKNVLKTIDDVTYTLPPGYPKRKQKAQRTRAGVAGYFSSEPIITTEEAVVNVKIDYKGPNDVFLSYKLKLFKASLK